MNSQENEIIARDNGRDLRKKSVEQKGYHYVWLQTSVVISSANIGKDDIVLDAGSGTGRITRRIAKNVKKIVL